MRETPNFIDATVTVLHREDGNTDRLVRQLKLLGLRPTLQWAPLTVPETADIVMVDADQGFDDLLPWKKDQAPCPVIALLASEAPGRIAWAIAHGAAAIIAKPVSASAVYPALVMAMSIHQERRQAQDHINHLEERVRLRPLVHGAVEKLMQARGIGEDEAYRILRQCAMHRRLPMEQIAAFILAGAEPLPEAS
ncbi:ANTAR domain-containing protein [Rhizobium deserti]|uniref:ANTAR domain-containing protein n=1 Tax=Rhizobium deserti TaxID=2547961 RepID=A0A4R5UA76_9HYPH|nr:ANTAR domain-containing protein [Rhizobium deserti]TDK31711.1 ANTAR domain-containing protein [Rhizobium deserti]